MPETEGENSRPEVTTTAQVEPIQPTVEMMQQEAIARFHQLHTGKGAVGQFKEISPLTDTVAVAVVRATKDKVIAKLELEHENHLLHILRENGFPALQTHGGVFEIDENKFALLMDWIPNANLIDGKTPDALALSLPAMVLGMKINTGKEAWAMQASKLGAQIRENAKSCDMKKAQAFAQTLGDEFKSLKNIMDTKGMIVGDLQILVRPNGKITIIDPLDVLQMVPKDPNDPAKGVDLIDVVNPDKPNSMGFMRSLMESAKMIDQVINFCEGICKAKDLQALEMAINPSVSSRYTGLSFPSGRPSESSGRNAFSEPSTPAIHRREPLPVRAATSMPSSPQQRPKTEPPKRPEPTRRPTTYTAPAQLEVSAKKPSKRPPSDTPIKPQPSERTVRDSSHRKEPLTQLRESRESEANKGQQEAVVKRQKAADVATPETPEEPKPITRAPPTKHG